MFNAVNEVLAGDAGSRLAVEGQVLAFWVLAWAVLWYWGGGSCCGRDVSLFELRGAGSKDEFTRTEFPSGPDLGPPDTMCLLAQTGGEVLRSVHRQCAHAGLQQHTNAWPPGNCLAKRVVACQELGPMRFLADLFWGSGTRF